MDYPALKTEISQPAYNGLSDADTAAALNAKSIASFQVVEYSDVASYLMLVEKYLPIKQSAESATPKTSAEAFMLAMVTFKTFDLAKPGVETAVVNLLDALIVDSLITVSDKAAILALADKTISRAEELGFGRVRPGDVLHARGIA